MAAYKIPTVQYPVPAISEWKRMKEVHAVQCPVAWQTPGGHRDRDIAFYPIFADPTCHIPPLISMVSSVFRSHPSSSVGFKKIVFSVP